MKAKRKAMNKIRKMSPIQLVKFFLEAERMLMDFRRRPATHRKGFFG